MKRIKAKINLILLVLLLILIGFAVYYMFFIRGKETDNPLFQEAEVARENKEYSLAISKYKESINTQPAYTPAYVKAAEILEEKGHTEEALAVLEKGASYAADKALIYQQIASIYANTANPEMALQTIQKAKEYKSTTTIYRDYISYLYLNNEFDKATEAITQIPGDDAYANYIKAILHFNDLKKALEYAQKAQTKSSEYKYQQLYETIKASSTTEDNTIEDLMLISVDAINAGEYALSLGALNQIKVENQYYEGSYIYDAFIYNRYRMYDQAIESLNTALLYTQNNYQVYKLLAYAHLERAELEEAEANIVSALGFPKVDADTYFLAAKIFKAQNKFSQALENLAKISNLKNNYNYTKLQIEVLLLNKQYEQTIAAANSFLEETPPTDEQRAIVMSLLAWANYNLGNKVQAKETLQEAESVYRFSPYTQYYLGLYYSQENESTPAKSYFEKAIDLDMEGHITQLTQQELNSLDDAESE